MVGKLFKKVRPFLLGTLLIGGTHFAAHNFAGVEFRGIGLATIGVFIAYLLTRLIEKKELRVVFFFGAIIVSIAHALTHALIHSLTMGSMLEVGIAGTVAVIAFVVMRMTLDKD